MVPEGGYNEGEVDIPNTMLRLEKYITELPGLYRELSSEELLYKPAPGKWSKQEVLGHLIDSAINNLKRATEIQFLPQPYFIISYQQNELVMVNRYQVLPLDHLLQLWQSLNQQMVYVVKNIPEESLALKVKPQYANNETKTLGWIIADYVAHLEHHLKQVFS